MSPNETGFYPGGWRKARRSMGNGECVEVAPTGGKVLVRDSKAAHSTVLSYSTGTWESFVSGAKHGDFDVLKLLFLFL